MKSPRLSKNVLVIFLLFLFASIPNNGITHSQTISQDEPEHPPIPLQNLPAPLRDTFGSGWVDCESERCSGNIAPLQARAEMAFGIDKGTRGSNSQLSIPRNLLLADINADGVTDFLQYTSNKIFVSGTDFEKMGILHLYTHRPIKRVLTGDFHGDLYDQTCVVTDDDALVCYGISTDRTELWWWFTQGTIVSDSEDAIVADFDGDGRDDVLVYPRNGGAFRLYSVKGDFFFEATPAFDQGNLDGVDEPSMQLRAGDFNEDGRDDLMVINPYGQILYYASVDNGSKNTFWWAFTTESGFVGENDHVTVARIDNDSRDDVVLRSQETGETRFFKMEWLEGVLPTIQNVSIGQIGVMDNSLLFWGSMHGALDEPGSQYREDAMVYDLNANMFVRSDARWDGDALTYWWAYTQHAPANHTGWAPFTAKPWLTIKCRFSDVSEVPESDQFYHDLNNVHMTYWQDISYGSWDLSDSVVMDEWHQMSISNAEWRELKRWDKAGECINAYSGSASGYVNVISIVNAEGDAGNAGGRVLITPITSNLTFLSHETGHTFGWGHSFDDTDRLNADWSQPGEYFDHWDIMSAMAVKTFQHPLSPVAGPGMNAPYLTKHNFIPSHRILKLSEEDFLQTRQVQIAALNHPEANGPLMVRIEGKNNDYYTIEYRMQDGWDQGIPQATVLVHRVKDGISYLITEGGTERLEDSVSVFWAEDKPLFTLKVHDFANEGFTANITIADAPAVSAGFDQIGDEGNVISLEPATFVTSQAENSGLNATIDWGDGSKVENATVSMSENSGLVEGTHIYNDDGNYNVTVSVCDQEGDCGEDSFEVTVNNVAPVLSVINDQFIYEDALFERIIATFSDVGSADTHTAVVDWGDGSKNDGIITQAEGTVAATHMYSDPGRYDVTITITDDDGDEDSGTFSILAVHGFLEFAVFSHEAHRSAVLVNADVNVTGSLGSHGELGVGRKAQITGDLLSVFASINMQQEVGLDGNATAIGDINVGVSSEVVGNITAGDDLFLQANSVVTGSVLVGGKVLQGRNVVVNGTIQEGATIAVPVEKSWVEFSAETSGSDVILRRGEVITLDPGDYGNLLVGGESSVTLSSGTYVFNSFEVGFGADLLLDFSDGPIVVHITEDMRFLNQTEMKITSASGDATNVIFLVEGDEIRFGRNGNYLGTFLGLETSITVGGDSVIEGALYGANITLGRGMTLNYSPAIDLFVSLFL